jgi:hypothetical protein
MTNLELPADGKPHAMSRFARFFAQPERYWHRATISSSLPEFTSVCFTDSGAVVTTANSFAPPNSTFPDYIVPVGRAKQAVSYIPARGEVSDTFLGGEQLVWINADRVDGSDRGYITLKSLQCPVEGC